MNHLEVEINGQLHQFEIEETSVKVDTGKVFVGIWNDVRNQYEVYGRDQNPKICPLGADEFNLNVAFALAEEDNNKEEVVELCDPLTHYDKPERFVIESTNKQFLLDLIDWLAKYPDGKGTTLTIS